MVEGGPYSIQGKELHIKASRTRKEIKADSNSYMSSDIDSEGIRNASNRKNQASIFSRDDPLSQKNEPPQRHMAGFS